MTKIEIIKNILKNIFRTDGIFQFYLLRQLKPIELSIKYFIWSSYKRFRQKLLKI